MEATLTGQLGQNVPSLVGEENKQGPEVVQTHPLRGTERTARFWGQTEILKNAIHRNAVSLADTCFIEKAENE